MKRIAFSLFLSMAVIFAWADESGTCGGNLTWTFVDSTKTLTISGAGLMDSFSLQSFSDTPEVLSWTDAPWGSMYEQTKTVIIEDGVMSIGNLAFWGFRNMTSVEIAGSVTSIGDDAFRGCISLISVEIPASVKTIGKGAFYVCRGLVTVTLGDNVTSIGIDAFSSCVVLASIVIPDSVTSIGGNVFAGCTKLASIRVSSGNSVYDSRNDCNALIETESNRLVAGCKNTIIPEGVSSIGGSAFWGCTELKSVIFPGSMTSIGESAFYGCTGLTSVAIPDGVSAIGDFAFYGCKGLLSVNIPNSVTSTGNAAFSRCTSLTSVVIPGSVSLISEQAFYECSGLISVEICEGVTSIGSNAFCRCEKLKTVKMPNSLIYIDSYAFINCKSLASIVVPGSVTSIGEYAFFGCMSLIDIYCYAEKSPVVTAESFAESYENSRIKNKTLHVPSNVVDEYKGHEVWSLFKDVIPLTDMEMKADDISLRVAEMDEVYGLSGKRINRIHDGMYPGLHIIRRADGRVEKVLVK